MMFWIGISLIILILAAGLIYSLYANKRVQRKEFDSDVEGAARRHPMLANPILISYVVFPILVIVAALIIFRYF